MITADQLREIMPGCPAEKFAEPLSKAMEEAEINTPLRMAAFISQVAHESGSLHYMRELASGEAYEFRASLGNTLPGDGPKFKARGPIGVTGKGNYKACSLALYGDLRLLDSPSLLEIPLEGCRASAWFWKVNKLNEFADKGDIDGVSDKINKGRKTLAYGDALGFKQRLAFYERAKEVLNVSNA